MASPGSGNDRHVTVRMGKEQVELIDSLGEAWGLTKEDGSVNRSETIRMMTEAFNGVLSGRFLSILDEDKLTDEWGAVGEMLALTKASEEPPADDLHRAQLQDVLKPLPDLIGAARIDFPEEGEVEDATH